MELELRRFESFRWGTAGQILGQMGRYAFTFETDVSAVPPGRYLLRLWPEFEPNAQNTRYANDLGGWHRGMIWVSTARGVRPTFLHRGDVDDDGGIVLCGRIANGTPSEFTRGYRELYPVIANAIGPPESLGMVWLNVPH